VDRVENFLAPDRRPLTGKPARKNLEMIMTSSNADPIEIVEPDGEANTVSWPADGFIDELAGQQDMFVDADAAVDDINMEAVGPEVSDPGQAPKKRKRRTKQEIADDEARAALMELDPAVTPEVTQAPDEVVIRSPERRPAREISEKTRLEMEAGRRALAKTQSKLILPEPSKNIILPTDRTYVPDFE
jgi:hypothetical protein